MTTHTSAASGVPKASTPRMGVAIPLANEQDTIDQLLTRVLAQIGPDDRIFCVLDNVSKDGTRGKIEDWSRRDPRVTLVWAPENRCVVDAYFRGYRAAMDAGCKWVLEMDGGLSHRPEEIPLFIAGMQQGFDYVGGCRFMKGGGHIGQVSRYVVSRGGTMLSNLLLGTRMRDMTSGFECFSRKAMQHVLDTGVKSRAHFFQTEIKFMLRDWNWLEVPIVYTNPSKSLGSSSIKEALRRLMELRREAKAARRG